MADRALVHYQPLTGPVWREPVAAELAWLPQDQPAVRLERRVPSELVWSTFYSLFTPASLQWLPTGQDAKPLERRILGSYAFLPFYSLYNPATLQWLPSGRWPVIAEVRKLGDFQQPAFDAIYKPEGLQWLFEGQLWARSAPYAIQSSWTVDPTVLIPPAVSFDPQFFPFSTTGAPLPQTLLRALQSTFDTPPLPPGPDVIPPGPAVIPTTIGGIETLYITQFPRPPQARHPIFVRNTENLDRADMEDIARILKGLDKE